jgi:phosphate acetyltransferase
MKGSLHTDELIGEVIRKATGLRTARRISHVFVMDVPTYPRLLLITDAAINVAPTLLEKADIVQNAIDLAHMLGTLPSPRWRSLPRSKPSTRRCRPRSTPPRCARWPTAARSRAACSTARWPSTTPSRWSPPHQGHQVGGRRQADILVVPDIESGNMLAKQLEYLADALTMAGIVLGARVPIVLTSRADSAETRTASTAVCRRHGPRKAQESLKP